MIQDIAPHKMYNQFRKDCVPKAGSPILIFSGNRLEYVMAFVENGRFSYPVYSQMPEGIRYIYLFSIDRDQYFLGLGDEKAMEALPAGLEAIKIRDLRPGFYRGDENRHLIFAAYTGGQLAGWYRDNRYCGTCAHMTVPSDTERALICPHCGRIIYPRILPAVIIGVTDKDRLLMTKYAGRGIPFYALVAGFNEIGETFEETVQREVMEEVGLKVKNIRYYKSQPWGIDGNILMGFYCDLDGEDDIHIDEKELALAEWHPRGALPAKDDNFTLTREMIRVFDEGKEPK